IEVNEIPFFDVELPYELALKIFRFLSKAELGRCAQVSKSWRVLAEDEVLWYRLFIQEGYHRVASVSDSPCWKSTLRDCFNTEKTVKYNWKNRVGSISYLQYEQGKVLCDVSSCDRLVLAGYTSGDVRLWDTLHWESGALNLQPSHSIRAETTPPQINLVQVTDSVACAAYENGCVEVWSTESDVEPIHHYRHLQQVCALDVSSDAPVVTSASGSEVRVDTPDEQGYWRTVCLTQLAKPVDGLLVVPGKRESPLVSAWAGESVYLLDPSKREEDHEEDDGARVLHFVYGQPVTCLDVSACRAALGVKSCGWGMNDGGNKPPGTGIGKPCPGSLLGQLSGTLLGPFVWPHHLDGDLACFLDRSLAHLLTNHLVHRLEPSTGPTAWPFTSLSLAVDLANPLA
ncbi:F-box/WD repeat-containing protein 8 isoform X1, partial [Tachysurus ichikawai]